MDEGWSALDDVDSDSKDERMAAADRLRAAAPVDNDTLPLFAGLGL
jgi:hypothetical protein